MNIIAALDDPNLLGHSLVGDPGSWRAWRGFLRAFFGLAMDDVEAELYRSCTGRAKLPEGCFRKGYLICGRGGGKTFVMSLVAVYLACFRNWNVGLAPGGRPIVLLVAPTAPSRFVLELILARSPV